MRYGHAFFLAVFFSSVCPSFADPLIDAILKYQFEEAKQLIANGADLTATDKEGNTALVYAAIRNNALLELLLQKGANPRTRNRQGFNVLHVLSARQYSSDSPEYAWLHESYYRAARILLQHGMDPELTTSNDLTALMLAAGSGADDVIRLLIEFRAEVERHDGSGQTALHHAVNSLKPSSVRSLLANKAKIDATDNSLRTPLILCADRPNGSNRTADSIARILIRAGAKLDLKDSNGRTAVMNAARSGQAEIETFLLKAGADDQGLDSMRLLNAVDWSDGAKVTQLLSKVSPNVRDTEQRTPLMISCQRGNSEITRLLLAADADVNARDERQQTALFYAVNYQDSRPDIGTVELLIKSGADVNAEDEEGITPLSLLLHTMYEGAEPLIRLLLQNRANPAKGTYYGLPCLFSAIHTRNPDVLSEVLNAGANPNTKYQNITALALAVESNEPQLVSLLLAKGATDPAVNARASQMVAAYRQKEELVAGRVPANIVQTEISLSRTSCEGFCPVYSVTIHGNGEVEYFGDANVDISGSYRYSLDQFKIREIITEAYRRDFFGMIEIDNAPIVYDMPSVSITITIQGKSVTRSSVSSDIWALGKEIDDLSGVKQWISTTPDFLLSRVKDSAITAAQIGAKNLMHAIDTGRTDIAQILLAAGSDPNARGPYEQTPLSSAAYRGDIQMVDLLLKYGAKPDEKSLIAAAESYSIDMLHHILAMGVSTRDLALHKVVRSLSGEKLEVLIATNAQVEMKDKFGNTPLLIAAGERNFEAVEALLKAGADPNEPNNNGLTALLAACGVVVYPDAYFNPMGGEMSEIVEALLNAGALPDVEEPKNNQSPLMLAVVRRDYYLTKALLSAGANPDAPDRSGNSPRSFAAKQRFAEIERLFTSN